MRSENGSDARKDGQKGKMTMKDVYAIYESKNDGKERSRWVRVGVAFPSAMAR
jgi:hypothetical protein